MKLTPLGNRVVLKPVIYEDKTASGIIITGQVKESNCQATVVEVGDTAAVSVGDVVIYSSYAGTEVELEKDNKYIIMSADDILAVVKEDKE